MTEYKPSANIVFPISDFDTVLADTIPLMKPPGKWAAFNSIRHLNRAWKLKDHDLEMAVFRAITAEEEAATALFHSLKRHHYNSSDRLKTRDHVHKNAVIPFMDAVSRVFARFQDVVPETEFLFDEEVNPPAIQIRFRLPSTSGEINVWGYPIPPLNFSLREQKGDQEHRIADFEAEIQQIAKEANAKTIIDHLRERANTRNRLLYAASTGYPGVECDAIAALSHFQRNVFTILRLFVLIDPYPQHQLFVQQCLSAFTSMLAVVPRSVKFE